MSNILEGLILASKKASSIAKACCESTENLLISEKPEGEANKRFDKDFKTIADVLAQESAKKLIVSQFSESICVRGEENNKVNNTQITIGKDYTETCEMLSVILPLAQAKHLAEAVHFKEHDIISDDIKLPSSLPPFDLNDLGVWIDPIDATSQFIAGVSGSAKEGDGLKCVTVLIGAYSKSTGKPILGVINQPFYNDGVGRILWGMSKDNVSTWNCNRELQNQNDNIVLVSAKESPQFINKLKELGFQPQPRPGAGYKLMKVALGEAKAYVVTQGTTFLWDTCAAHSILQAKGGDIVSFKTLKPITYNHPISDNPQTHCNQEGIIAYSSPDFLDKIKEIIEKD